MSFLNRFRRKSGSGSRDNSVVRDESSCNSSRRNSNALSSSSDSRDGSTIKISKKNRIFSKISNSLSPKDKSQNLLRKSDSDFNINPYNTYQKNIQPEPVHDDPDPFSSLYDKQIIKSDQQNTSTYKTRKSLYNILSDDLDFPKENEEDKYKTITLSSYRKFFRDKYLSDQVKQPQYNPSWFVEVEKKPEREQHRERDKAIPENSQEILIFDNENYRRNSRSPLRYSHSPVRRTDTFRVTEPSPSIRIQIRNSPQKLVPVGVAKPMVTSAWKKTTAIETQYQPSSRSTTIKPVQQQRAPYQTRIQIKPPSPKVRSVTHFGEHVIRPNVTATSERLSRPNVRVPPNNNRIRIQSKSPIKIPWR